MHFNVLNVNDAFLELTRAIHFKTVKLTRKRSRNGDVLKFIGPVMVTYNRSRERVLFNQQRDCNPFFHVYEALWMLAGRNDVEPLSYYNSQMKEYSDDGKTLNGAYGYRWRIALGSHSEDRYVDQLQVLIEHLREQPNSRRAVLQMWNPQDDLMQIGDPVRYSKDVCCNLCVKFSIREEWQDEEQLSTPQKYLDMTVVNRSNDMIWGMLGANVVHFSFLHEYMANCIGVEVGMYHQITDDLHVYLEKWEPDKWLKGYDPAIRTMWDDRIFEYGVHPLEYYSPPKLVQNQTIFDDECKEFVEMNKNGDDIPGDGYHWEEPFLDGVARPMCQAFHMHKRREYGRARTWIEKIVAMDWRIAARNWILKRKEKWEKRNV